MVIKIDLDDIIGGLTTRTQIDGSDQGRGAPSSLGRGGNVPLFLVSRILNISGGTRPWVDEGQVADYGKKGNKYYDNLVKSQEVYRILKE